METYRLDLPVWTAQAWALEHNLRHSRRINAACTRHIQRFPASRSRSNSRSPPLLSLRELLHHSRRFGRPHRGNRVDHWTTAAIMDVNNQLARLERRNAA